MSSSLATSATLAQAKWFIDLVRAAMVEYALQHTSDPLSKAMVADPAYRLPLFCAVLADNATISTPAWQDVTDAQKEADIRAALVAVWPVLSSTLPNLGA